MITISLPSEQRARLSGYLKRAGRREIGGILMGEQVAPDHFQIVEFSVDPVTGTAAHFVRSPEHHSAALGEFFRRTGADYKRFNYLGEWHSHPSFPVRPSSEDVASMQGLVDGERDIDFSALLIVRLRYWLMFEARAYMFVRQSPSRAVSLTL
ncbi:Mov34/MPN/PAD-1 family protein [Rubellimicrobium arenae]|uniref:Mov34/MPN/PAD-1 family protein n=1 Tax=Rubellimicrobium arenae TaxID=2817372 RepID=UPI001B300A9F|nr:Mov34/MPN/PAD-1 family protein [Rubellimicrobium arenae]